MDTTIRIDNGEHRPKLAAARRLIAVYVTPDKARIFRPGGPITRDELELLDIPGNSAVLPLLLPGKAVAVGAKWAVPADTLAMLLGIDSASSCDVQCTFKEVTVNKLAKIEFAGNGLKIGVTRIDTRRAIPQAKIIICRVHKQRVLRDIAVKAGSVCPLIIVSADITPNIVKSRLGNIVRRVQIDAAAVCGIANNVARNEALPGRIRNSINISGGISGISHKGIIDQLAAANQHCPATDRHHRDAEHVEGRRRSVAVDHRRGRPGRVRRRGLHVCEAFVDHQ